MKRLLVVLTIVLVMVAGVAGWWWVRGSLPVLDGQQVLQGLRAPVEILTDAHGVPAVYARDQDDAWFAAGVLHARDRRWQMELYRRVTMGRLSEALGDTTIPVDQRFLTLGIRDAAKAEWERAAPPVKQALERYAEGVNAATSELVGRKRPIEFQVARHHAAGVGADRFVGSWPAPDVAACREPSIRARTRGARREVWRGESATADGRLSLISANDTVDPRESAPSIPTKSAPTRYDAGCSN